MALGYFIHSPLLFCRLQSIFPLSEGYFGRVNKSRKNDEKRNVQSETTKF
jgi:hypothetical protein